MLATRSLTSCHRSFTRKSDATLGAMWMSSSVSDPSLAPGARWGRAKSCAWRASRRSSRQIPHVALCHAPRTRHVLVRTRDQPELRHFAEARLGPLIEYHRLRKSKLLPTLVAIATTVVARRKQLERSTSSVRPFTTACSGSRNCSGSNSRTARLSSECTSLCE
jgi:hypothetical protein